MPVRELGSIAFVIICHRTRRRVKIGEVLTHVTFIFARRIVHGRYHFYCRVVRHTNVHITVCLVIYSRVSDGFILFIIIFRDHRS